MAQRVAAEAVVGLGQVGGAHGARGTQVAHGACEVQ